MVRDGPWTSRAVIERAIETLRHDGPKALWFRVLGEICYRRAILFELDLAGYRPRDAIPANIQFDILSASNLEDFLGLVPHLDEQEVRRRLAADEVCMLGYVGGRPAYAGWLAPGQVRIDYLGVEAFPGPGAAYSYEVYVDPTFRGLGLSIFGLDIRARLSRERGFAKHVSIVVPENHVGISHALGCGCQPIGWVYCLRVGRLKRCWIQTSVEPAPLRIVS